MITLHTGKLGTGKSYSATRMVWKTINQGIDCYVNWPIDFTDYVLHRERSLLGKVSWLWKKVTFGNEKMGKIYYFDKLPEIYGIQNGELFYDEAHADLNARDWQKIPRDFVKKLTQSRKYHLNMHFITQHQGQVDLIVRRISNEIIIHRKFFRFFFWKAYDGEKIEILSNPTMPPPKAEGFGVTIFTKRFAKCYNSFGIFGDRFDPYDKGPMWEYEKVEAIKRGIRVPQVESKSHAVESTGPIR